MSAVSGGQCRVFATPEQLARVAADWIVERAEQRAQCFALGLSGGTTPKRVYELVGEAPRRERFPRHETRWFWATSASPALASSAVIAFLVTDEHEREAGVHTGRRSGAAGRWSAAARYRGLVRRPRRGGNANNQWSLNDGHRAIEFGNARAAAR